MATGSVPSPLPKYLYKILADALHPLPADIQADTTLPSTSLDVADGFIHLSTASQVAFVLGNFFGSNGKDDDPNRVINLVKIDYEKLVNGEGEVQWDEVPAVGQSFAHLRGTDLKGSVVVDVVKVEREDGEGGKGWEAPVESLKGRSWLV